MTDDSRQAAFGDRPASGIAASAHLWRAGAVLAATIGALLLAFVALNRVWPTPWTNAARGTLRELWIGSNQRVPPDPSNRFADDVRAARLGAQLFRDPRLSGSGRVACSTCHRPELGFTDGLVVARGEREGTRHTPSVVAAAHGPAYFWDGRRDSQWAQALAPIESSLEMNGTRTGVVHVVVRHYQETYEAVFGPLPQIAAERLRQRASPLGSPEARAAWDEFSPAEKDALNRVFANVGKAIAAYQRTLEFEPSRFDEYASHVLRGNHLVARLLFSSDELAGLELFIGRANCTFCHRGPLLTGHEFFALALPFGAAGPDVGRADAFHLVRHDPFNCTGRYSDARPDQCTELRFLADDRLGFLANFKTPSLRNVSITAPYMHAGQFSNLEQVLDHYSRAPPVPYPEHTDIRPLHLSETERGHIVAFLGTLTSRVRDPIASETSPPYDP